jgi:predicted O-methyltransferase YrrM
MPRITLRRLALASLVSAALGVIVLVVGVAASWWSAPVAVLAGLAAAMLGGLALLAVGVRRVQQLLHAGLRQTNTRRDHLQPELDRLRGRVDQLHASLTRTTTALAETTSALDRTAAGIEQGVHHAMHEVQAAAGEDRLELLQQLGRLIASADQLRGEIRAVRVEQAERLEELAGTAQANAAAGTRTQARLPDRIFAKVAAQLDLRRLIEPRAPLPPLGGWALDPETMHEVARLLWQLRPEVVVECGSGSSTVWIGYLVERLGLGRVVSLEHDERFLRSTRAEAAAHGLQERVEIRHAPLQPWTDPGGRPRPWYDLAAIDDLKGIGLLLVDGPPQSVGRHARYPAGPLLIPRCAADAVIVLDDTDRADERTVGRRWLDEWPDLERHPTNRTGPADYFRRVPGHPSTGTGRHRDH